MIEMIEVVKFKGKNPAVAYTDFSKVYISTCLSHEEELTAIKHEKGHIWLQHYLRQKIFKPQSFELWNVAADMEIARYLYNDLDEHVINAPRSNLKNGISKKDCDKYPHCQYAEDFYNELLKENENKLNSLDGEANERMREKHDNQDLDSEEIEDIKEIIKKAIAQSEKEQERLENKKSIEIAQKKTDHFLPAPSLAGEIDKYLGRAKRERVPSWRRFSKKESENGLIIKGKACHKRVPKITVYVDRSGSFNSEKTFQATNCLKKILKKYRCNIKQDIIWFNDDLLSSDPKQGGGGTNYQAVIDNILRDCAQLSIIITDDDPCALTIIKKPPATLVISIGCHNTNIAKILNAKEFPDNV